MPSSFRRRKAFSRVAGAALLLAASLTTPSSPAGTECRFQEEDSGAIVEILGPDTLLLADGRAVRLIGALPPRMDKPWSQSLGIEDRLKRALEELSLGRKAVLRFGGRRRDRYGRLLAHVFIEQENAKELWLQAALIEKGLALAYSFADNRACMHKLQQKESAARKANAGFWGRGLFSVRDARNASSMYPLRYSYQLVEGRVHEVAVVRGRIYINFDENWRKDFTARIEPGDRHAFPGRGAGLLKLKGQRVRVRGWLRWRNGPEIKVTHPEQIELLDAQVRSQAEVEDAEQPSPSGAAEPEAGTSEHVQ